MKALENEKYGMMVLCKNDKKIVGWLWITIKENSITNNKYIYLKSIYIDRRYRKCGYSKELLKYIKKFADKYKIHKIVAKVDYQNNKIIKLLTKYNFQKKHITMEKNI